MEISQPLYYQMKMTAISLNEDNCYIINWRWLIWNEDGCYLIKWSWNMHLNFFENFQSFMEIQFLENVWISWYVIFNIFVLWVNDKKFISYQSMTVLEGRHHVGRWTFTKVSFTSQWQISSEGRHHVGRVT